MAVITSLALGNDPLQEVYQQGQLRSHYLNILECGNIKPFPLLRTRRRPRNAITDTMTFTIHCYCRMKDDGETMIECSKCKEWYHQSCVKKRVKKKEIWYCNYCKDDQSWHWLFHYSLYVSPIIVFFLYKLYIVGNIAVLTAACIVVS